MRHLQGAAAVMRGRRHAADETSPAASMNVDRPNSLHLEANVDVT